MESVRFSNDFKVATMYNIKQGCQTNVALGATFGLHQGSKGHTENVLYFLCVKKYSIAVLGGLFMLPHCLALISVIISGLDTVNKRYTYRSIISSTQFSFGCNHF